ncbi:hypothetical protein AB7M17_000726 [Bradyrhizobium sp. USDA 377]
MGEVESVARDGRRWNITAVLPDAASRFGKTEKFANSFNPILLCMGLFSHFCLERRPISIVVLAKARTHYPREGFGEDELLGTPTAAIDRFRGMGPGVRQDDSGDQPAPARFFCQTRCTAQVQPGGCEARSLDASSFAGVAAKAFCCDGM